MFDPYFGPIKGDLGPTGQFTLIHRNNLVAPGVKVSYAKGNTFNVFLHWQAVWLDEPTDSFGRIGIREITGGFGDFAGHQIHLGLRVPLPQLSSKLEFGSVYFDNGEFFRNAPNATGNGNPFYFFKTLSYAF